MALYAYIHDPHFPICLTVLKDSLCKKKQAARSCLALRAFLLPLLRPLISYDTKTI